MKVVPLAAPGLGPFVADVRGPELRRWLIDANLLFDDSDVGFAPPTRSIQGAQADEGWVVFHGLQVLQIVPEEVHSYWHLSSLDEASSLAKAWRVENSSWLASFSPRHLQGQQHFVLTFYDELVEVICRELLFGPAEFQLEAAIIANPQLAYAHLRRAMSLEKQGKRNAAIADYERYIALASDLRSVDASSVEYARRCLAQLRECR